MQTTGSTATLSRSAGASPAPIAPRSALRHRPIASDEAVPTEEPPRVSRASRTRKTSEKATSQPEKVTAAPTAVSAARTKARPQAAPLLLLTLGMSIALVVVFLGQLVAGWCMTTWDDLHYGRPRTFQMDAYVGHETGKTPSHFIALNLHGRAEVIEFPGGDATHAHVYLGPQLAGPDADLAPVLISFVDTQHNHHPDMIIQTHGIQITFHNVQDSFQPGQ